MPIKGIKLYLRQQTMDTLNKNSELWSSGMGGLTKQLLMFEKDSAIIINFNLHDNVPIFCKAVKVLM